MTMPAKYITSRLDLPIEVLSVGGTLGRGNAYFTGNIVVQWEMGPPAMWPPSLRANLLLRGPQSDASAEVGFGYKFARASAVSGILAEDVLSLAPKGTLAVECTGKLGLRIEEIYVSPSRFAGSGQASLSSTDCLLPSGTNVTTPPLDVVLSSVGPAATLQIFAQGSRTPTLGTVTATPPNRVVIRLEPEGGALLEGFPNSQATVLELEL